MNKAEIIKQIKEILPEYNIKENELMSKHTTFKIGGPAEIFIKIDDIEQLKKILKLSKKTKVPLTIIGNGSNLLVKDEGIDGITAKIEIKKLEIKNTDKDKVEVIAGAGIQLGYLGQKLLKEEIQGFEELSGIPGTIGGAVVMNAGAHGKEIKDIITQITAIDYEGKIHTFKNEEAEFEYRKSKFSSGKYIIIETILQLEKGNQKEIKSKMEEYLQYRKEKQPIEFSSAGSTFKRGTDYITAKLIDESGLKGYSIGEAEISTKHAGFIINKGNATAQNVLDLVKYVSDKIYEKFEKKLELEIKIIGK